MGQKRKFIPYKEKFKTILHLSMNKKMIIKLKKVLRNKTGEMQKRQISDFYIQA